jgi:hypothetical protein
MKSENRVVFIARDGEEFLTEAQCRPHERRTSGAALIGLTAAQVEAARTGADPGLAEAFRQFTNEMRNFQRRQPNGPAENNGGDKTGSTLPDGVGADCAIDSLTGTERDHITA